MPQGCSLVLTSGTSQCSAAAEASISRKMAGSDYSNAVTEASLLSGRRNNQQTQQSAEKATNAARAGHCCMGPTLAVT